MTHLTPEQMLATEFSRQAINAMLLRRAVEDRNFLLMPSGRRIRWDGRPFVKSDDHTKTDAQLRAQYPEVITI